MHSELKMHALHMELQWMVSTSHFQHWNWRFTHWVSQAALLHSIRPSPLSTSLPKMISLQSHLYKVTGCFPCRFRLPWPSLVAGTSVTVSSMPTIWTKGPEFAWVSTPVFQTHSSSISAGFRVGLKEGRGSWKTWYINMVWFLQHYLTSISFWSPSATSSFAFTLHIVADGWSSQIFLFFTHCVLPNIFMKKALEVWIFYLLVIQLNHSTSRIQITSLLVLMGVFFACNVTPWSTWGRSAYQITMNVTRHISGEKSCSMFQT